MKKNNLKEQLVDTLLENGKVQEGDIINHSYSTSRLNGRRTVERQDEMPALTTRPDTMGVTVKRYKNYVTWKDKQGNFNTECNRASMPNDLSLTLATANVGKVIDNVRERERAE